jgi:hypothetical protein
MTNKVALGVLNQIWSRWGFNEIKRGERERKRVKGVVVDVSKFSMKTLKEYDLFDVCFDKTEYGEENENDEMG